MYVLQKSKWARCLKELEMFKKLFDAIYVKTLHSIHNCARNILDLGKTCRED